jgi:hypothetical protein
LECLAHFRFESRALKLVMDELDTLFQPKRKQQAYDDHCDMDEKASPTEILVVRRMHMRQSYVEHLSLLLSSCGWVSLIWNFRFGQDARRARNRCRIFRHGLCARQFLRHPSPAA